MKDTPLQRSILERMEKLIFNFAFLVFTFFIFAPSASAVDLTVTCADEGPCNTNPPGEVALFYETNWLPGDTVTQNIGVINNDVDDDCNLYLDIRNEKDIDGLASVIFTVVKQGASDLYGIRDGNDRASSNRTLRNLFDAGDIYLTTVPKLDNRTIVWTATFDFNAGDEYQGVETIFDFDLHFSCGIPPGPNPSPSPSPGASPSPGPGASPSPSPAGTGGLTGLMAVAPAGGLFRRFFAPAGAAVAGVTTEEVPLEEGKIEEGEVKGAEECCPKICPWWWIFLMAQALLISRHLLIKSRKEDEEDWAVLPIGLTLVSIVGHWILHRIFVGRFGYEESLYCRWFWLISIGATLLLSIVFSWATRKEEERNKS